MKKKQATLKYRRAEFVLYPESDDLTAIIKAIKSPKSPIKRYAYILHDKDVKEDGTPIKPHYHVIVDVGGDKGPFSLNALAKLLKLPLHRLELSKQPFKYRCAYLIHLFDVEKYHYSVDEVTANFDFERMIAKLKREKNPINKRALKDDLIFEISENRVKNLKEALNYLINEGLGKSEAYELLTSYSLTIERCLRIRNSIENEANEQTTIYISGKSGVGKSTLAKKIAENHGYNFFTGAVFGNDILSGYNNEDCLILDDFRKEDFSQRWQFLLQLLDPYNRGYLHSRYANKNTANLKLAILTSVEPFEEVLSFLATNKDEDLVQIKRRIPLILEIDEEYITEKRFNFEKNVYEITAKRENEILKSFENSKEKQQKTFKLNDLIFSY